MPAMKVLACTGGIGSGKTFVCKIFERLGVPAYYTDDAAKSMYGRPDVMEKVKKAFGDGIYADGEIRKDALAACVFSDPVKLKTLESILHPAVFDDFSMWKQRQSSEFGFVIMESAIILEKPLFRNAADKILTVSAPLEVMVERVMERDGATRGQVMRRIGCQMPDEMRIRNSDFVIFADGKAALLPQIERILDYFDDGESL